MSKLRKKKDLKKGDVIFIIEKSMMIGSGKEEVLEEYVIDEINSSSLYFYKDSGVKVRIGLNDLKGKGPLSSYVAYVNKEDYYKQIETQKRRQDAIEVIFSFANNASKYKTSDLEMVADYLNGVKEIKK